MRASATLADVLGLLDSWFDYAAFPDDPGNGLAVAADPAQEIRIVGYAVNCSFEVIRDAADRGVDLLVTHHAAWDEIDLALAGEKRERLTAAGVAHYVCHLPLDGDDRGTAATLCELLGIPVEGAFADVGGGRMAGRYGALPEPVSLNAFVGRVSETLGVVPYVLLGAPRVSRVAVVTGAGGLTTLLEEARTLGCDTYLTGEGGLYTKLYARETGLNLVLGTHTATERPGIEAFARRLCAALPGLEAVGLRETPFE